jgi:hypothetical protein
MPPSFAMHIPPTSFNLELFRCSNVVLAVYNHEPLILDLTPVLGLRIQEVSLLVDQA